MATDKSFLGVGWSFPPQFDRGGVHFNKGGKLKTVREEEDIQESLYILLSTTPGERIMQPAYGCRLKAMVFENIGESEATEIRDVISRAILFFEPRITLEKIDIDTEDMIEGLLKINIVYTVRTTNTRFNLVYPFYFREGTNVEP